MIYLMFFPRIPSDYVSKILMNVEKGVDSFPVVLWIGKTKEFFMTEIKAKII